MAAQINARIIGVGRDLHGPAAVPNGNEEALWNAKLNGPDQKIRFGVRERSQQDPIDEAEDSRIGPDAEPQRQNRRSREAWALAQHPQAETDVLPEVVPPEPAA